MSNPTPKNNPTNDSTEPKRFVVKLPTINKKLVKVAAVSFTTGAAVATFILKMNGFSSDDDYLDPIDEVDAVVLQDQDKTD